MRKKSINTRSNTLKDVNLNLVVKSEDRNSNSGKFKFENGQIMQI